MQRTALHLAVRQPLPFMLLRYRSVVIKSNADFIHGLAQKEKERMAQSLLHQLEYRIGKMQEINPRQRQEVNSDPLHDCANVTPIVRDMFTEMRTNLLRYFERPPAYALQSFFQNLSTSDDFIALDRLLRLMRFSKKLLTSQETAQLIQVCLARQQEECIVGMLIERERFALQPPFHSLIDIVKAIRMRGLNEKEAVNEPLVMHLMQFGRFQGFREEKQEQEPVTSAIETETKVEMSETNETKETMNLSENETKKEATSPDMTQQRQMATLHWLSQMWLLFLDYQYGVPNQLFSYIVETGTASTRSSPFKLTIQLINDGLRRSARLTDQDYLALSLQLNARGYLKESLELLDIRNKQIEREMARVPALLYEGAPAVNALLELVRLETLLLQQSTHETLRQQVKRLQSATAMPNPYYEAMYQRVMQRLQEEKVSV